jgi:hypothetical protein
MEQLEMPKDFFKAWQHLPESFRQALVDIRNNPDEIAVADRVMVAPCPNCGSTNTRSCEQTAIEEPTVALCLDCGCLGCLTCGAVFNDGETECPHWSLCRSCPEPKNERGYCSIPLWECPTIQEWKANRQHPFEF